MSDAPEVIWAVTEPNDVSADILGDVYAQQLPDGMNGTPVKYVRADRIEELEAKLKMAEVSLRVINALDPEASMDGCSRYTLITIVGLMGGKARDALAKLTGEKP